MLPARDNLTMQELTLIIIREGDKILLGKKKRRFGAGRYNGFGGKLQPGESILESLKRELKEEAEIEVNQITKIGEVVFYSGREDVINEFEIENNILVHIFLGKEVIGTPNETEEMDPKWFNIDEIPFDNMWPDDKYWMPYLLKETPFKGHFKFAGDSTTIVEHNIEETEPFE